jgi:hypothetical protein
VKCPEPPQPDKPLAEMTPRERAAFRTKLRREIRDRQVATGTKTPKTMRETEIWMALRAERDERLARRIALASRGQQDDTGDHRLST